MPSLPLYDLTKKKVGSIEVSDAVFAGEVKPHLINAAVRAQIAWRYELKTANCKTRTEVSGTRKKMFRQKGTGQARHGDSKAPIFVGGGKAHGPKPHIRTHKINKKVMRAALISALSLHQKEDRLFVVDKLELDKPNAKSVATSLKQFSAGPALFINVAGEANEKQFNLSARNLSRVKVLRPEGVNVFDVMKYPNLIISKKAMEKLTERLTHA